MKTVDDILKRLIALEWDKHQIEQEQRQLKNLLHVSRNTEQVEEKNDKSKAHKERIVALSDELDLQVKFMLKDTRSGSLEKIWFSDKETNTFVGKYSHLVNSDITDVRDYKTGTYEDIIQWLEYLKDNPDILASIPKPEIQEGDEDG
jgi:hypothetical protein